MKAVLAYALVCLVGLTACTTVLCGCIEPTTAMVAGRVTAANGDPLAGAMVRGLLSASEPTCAVGALAGIDSTDAFGRYRARLIAFRNVAKCVFVEVVAPPGSALRDTIVGPFRLTLRDEEPIDFLLLDIRLTP